MVFVLISTMNTIGFFEIQSSEPDREMAFYTKLFGWKFEPQPFAPVEYYHITTPGIFGGLLRRQAPAPTPEFGTNAFTCSIQVTNFDLTAAQIIRLGGKMAMPKFLIPGRCWQGYFVDTDNNTFGIFEVLPEAQST